MSDVKIELADYQDVTDAKSVVKLLNAYACDPMGGGEPLSPYVKENLCEQLSAVPGAFTVLAFVDGKAAGLINCFMGFSTFKCKPIVNIHDVAVLADFRGLGLSRKMLEKVEQIAIDRGCCKLTLEVLEGNPVAKSAYLNYGFKGYELDASHGKAMFWEKPCFSEDD